MPKTKDAFAFRNFNETRILQRPYFRQFNLPNKSDVEIIQSLQAADDDSVDTMENKLSTLKALLESLFNFHEWIYRHIDRMDKVEIWQRLKKKKVKSINSPTSLDYYKKVFFVAQLAEKVNHFFYVLNKDIEKCYRKIFTERLRHYRQAAGLTQKELGYLIHVSPTVISRYMKGKRDMPIYELIRIAKALNVSADKLLGIT